MQLIEPIVAASANLTALRRDLHMHPELAFEERRTSGIVAQRLRALGLDVAEGLAGTGVVGTLRRGSALRSIGLRADMDALPLQERNCFAHASRYAGRMHACGHDGHVAMLLGAAEYLARHGRFSGTVQFIFQPAEEKGGGAQRMIEAGLFEHHPCEAVYALHNWPDLPLGEFGLRPGALMAGTAGFEIDVHGRSAHAAMPHQAVDALLVGCQLAHSLQLLISRERDPRHAAVLSVTQIHSGETMGVVAGEAVLRGTVRYFTPAVLARIEAGMQRMATHVAAAHGARARAHVTRNYPPLVNDPRAAAAAAAAMAQVVGPSGVNSDYPPTLAAEDFAYMLQARAGAYALIGNGQPERPEATPGSDDPTASAGAGPCLLHSDRYDFNDALLPIGATYWVRLVEQELPA